MKGRTMRGRDMAEQSQHRRTGGTEDRRILAVGKRVDHRWLIETNFATRRAAHAAHAA
jgi:hypothetical protein